MIDFELLDSLDPDPEENLFESIIERPKHVVSIVSDTMIEGALSGYKLSGNDDWFVVPNNPAKSVKSVEDEREHHGISLVWIPKSMREKGLAISDHESLYPFNFNFEPANKSTTRTFKRIDMNDDVYNLDDIASHHKERALNWITLFDPEWDNHKLVRATQVTMYWLVGFPQKMVLASVERHGDSYDFLWGAVHNSHKKVQNNMIMFSGKECDETGTCPGHIYTWAKTTHMGWLPSPSEPQYTGKFLNVNPYREEFFLDSQDELDFYLGLGDEPILY